MITRFLIRNPRVVWLLMFAICAAGLVSFWSTPRMEDPILSRRVAVISANYPGANAREIESTVTIPIEGWLSEFSTVKRVRSNSRSDIGNVVVELDDGVQNTQEVWQQIESVLQERKNELPARCTSLQLDIFPLKAYANCEMYFVAVGYFSIEGLCLNHCGFRGQTS